MTARARDSEQSSSQQRPPRKIISQPPTVSLSLQGRQLVYREMGKVCKCYSTRNGWSGGVEKLRSAAAVLDINMRRHCIMGSRM